MRYIQKNNLLKEPFHYEFRFMMITAGLIITFNLCSGIMGPIIISLGTTLHHISVTCGVIPFCLAFFLMDIFTNQYGAAYAKRLSTGVAVCNLIMALTLYLSLKLPLSKISPDILLYQNAFGPMIKSFFSGMIAALVAFYINSIIFSKLFFHFQGKHLWLRCLAATSLGELIYSSIFNGIYFYHILGLHQIMNIVIGNYGFKFVFEVLTLPLTYFFVYLFQKYETNISGKYSNLNSLNNLTV